MPYKDKVQNRQYQREWANRKHHGLPTRIINRPKVSDEQKKQQIAQLAKNHKAKLRRLRDEIFGTKCFLCGYGGKLNLHRKDGKAHRTDLTMKILKEKEKWVQLCAKCHTGSHFCMSLFGWNWDDIVKASGKAEDHGSNPCVPTMSRCSSNG